MTSIIGKRAHATIRWSALLVALTITAASLLQAANIKSASADTGGYTWPDAPCASSGSSLGQTSGTGYWCSGYNWGESTCPANDGYCTAGNKMNGYYLYDQWGESFRNCVSYTAYKLSTVFNVNPSSWGNGADWNNSALAHGYTDDTSPQIGDIAQWDGTTQNQWGHVAYVYNVVGGVAYYDEYNYAGDGNFLNTYTSATQGTPTHWIHIASVPNPTPPLAYYARNLVGNAGFNSDGNFTYWSAYSGTNKQWYAANNGLTGGTNPYEGDQFLATNAYAAGGSIYQDLAITTSNGQDYCASALVTTADQSGTTGGSGSLNVYNLNNGTIVNSGSTNFSNLPNNNQWQRVTTCLPITGSGNDLRVQIYPTLNGKTIGVDAVTVNQDAAANSGFEVGTGWWSTTQNTNFTTYGANNGLTGGTQPYEGSHFGATNAAGAQASIYQDLALSLSNGNEYCVNAMLTTADQSGVSGGFGDLNLYAMNNGTVVSAGGTHFSGLPNNNKWVPVNTCVYVTGTANTLRVQLYPGYNSPTLGVDALNVNQDLVANGGFEAGMGWWSTYPGTNTATYAAGNGLTGGTNPPEGSNFGATNAYAAGGSIYQDIAIPLSTGQDYCVTALVTTADQSGTTGGSGSLNLYNMNGGTVVNSASTSFSNLPNNNQWVQEETCINITGSGNVLRVQLYPTVNGKTLGIDAVNML